MRFTIIVIDNVTGYRREIQTDTEPEWLRLLRNPGRPIALFNPLVNRVETLD